ncbi:glycosyltransferase involved in cell wall biosynthesis [Stella humosa]|uniref:Glycosyltransferase involved in cell wall biosynthesis n=1 Tax=Stella humosa TaxID=94 RepID=A0A3N1L0N5_9PROT|nr:glycosyltransferase [Stella humosa]ROP83075.1 glycosyltransferase involved in cell wall biosynthesis [Stella humosa]BBK30149.1 glycosyl transferase [Stella humosa]
MRVLLLTRYGRLGATSRQRHLLFLPALAEAGISVTVDALLDDAYVRGMHAGVRPRPGAILAAYAARIRRLLAARDWDVLWIEKELLPWLPALAEGWLARCRVPMVVDYDDAWFHRYDRHPRPLVRRLLGRKIDRVMAAATTVVAGNRYIADHARRAGASRVEIVPTVVDTDALGTTPAPAGRPFTIGWIGTPANARYLDPIRPALARVCAEAGGRMLLVGAGPDALEGLPGEVRAWDGAREAADLAAMDVGLMPLPDTPFERGKCGYKLIQYMAAGRPSVASPVGVNAGILAEGAGLLAGPPEEWATALLALARDPDGRARMGTAARARAVDHYSLAAWAPATVRILREAKERR